MLRGMMICMAAAILALGWICHAEHEKARQWEAECASARQSLEKMQKSLAEREKRNDGLAKAAVQKRRKLKEASREKDVAEWGAVRVPDAVSGMLR